MVPTVAAIPSPEAVDAYEEVNVSAEDKDAVVNDYYDGVGKIKRGGGENGDHNCKSQNYLTRGDKFDSAMKGSGERMTSGSGDGRMEKLVVNEDSEGWFTARSKNSSDIGFKIEIQ